MVQVFAPGRVNLIGDHTDYTGGLALPMAIDMGTTVTGSPAGDAVRFRSEELPGDAVIALDVAEPSLVEPSWARYVAGVVSVLRPRHGFRGQVTTTLPIGAGLSSSAALEVAVALALGFGGSRLELALACQRAEQAASGVPCGVMDQLTSASGLAGHALLVDCGALRITPVAIPDGAEVVVVDSGERRRLADSAYAERRQACQQAEAVIGPLGKADSASVARLVDPVLRARARHVVTENARVQAFAGALQAGDLRRCGALMAESHQSLKVDFDVSTCRLDELVAELVATPGVFGARLTGAGFGGCVVALTRPGVLERGWVVRAVDGAKVLSDDVGDARA
jgi:galactokinase